MQTVTTNFGDEADLKAAVESAGRVVVEETPVTPASPDPEVVVSEKPAKPGEETPVAVPVAEPVAVTEPAKPEAQVETQAAPQETAKPTHGFKSKAEKAQALVDRLQQDLDLERGSKTKLQEQLAAATAELERLKPPDPKVQPTGPVPPAKPKRPTRKDFEFDEDKYEAALSEYDNSLEKYFDDKRTYDDGLKAVENQRAAAIEAERAAWNTWVDNREAGAKFYPDFQEVASQIPEGYDLPQGSAMRAYIFRSKNTADLMYHFYQDHLQAGDKDLERIAALEGIEQVVEMRDLENRLVAERNSRIAASAAPPPPAPAPPAAAAPAKPPEAVPAKPKPPAPVVEPLETLGGSRTGSGGVPTLAELAERAQSGDKAARDAYWKARSAGAQTADARAR